jgi:xylulokinase
VPVRRVCPQLELSPKVRVVFAGNDQTAGAYANGNKNGQLILTLGTALVVYRYAGEVAGPYRPASCWGPYPDGGFYELVTRDEGCAALDWAVGKLMPNDEAGFMKSAESAAPGVALFYPQHMQTEAAWLGPDNLGARTRAVLEGICFNARELLEEDLEPEPGNGPMVIIGGGSKSDFWLDMLTNVLNRAVRRGEGDILLGAAMMARPGIKPPAQVSEVVRTPDPDTAAQYEKVFRAWHNRTPLNRS